MCVFAFQFEPRADNFVLCLAQDALRRLVSKPPPNADVIALCDTLLGRYVSDVSIFCLFAVILYGMNVCVRIAVVLSDVHSKIAAME